MRRQNLFIKTLICSLLGGWTVLGVAPINARANEPKQAPAPQPSPKAAVPRGPNFQKRSVQIGSRKIVVEVADTDEKRAHGLMFRTSMPTDAGMLFIFDDEQVLSFWMKNTLIPLSIAYIDAKGLIVDIQEMDPASEIDTRPRVYPSRSRAKYALEMNQGWFEKNKIKVGDKLLLP